MNLEAAPRRNRLGSRKLPARSIPKTAAVSEKYFSRQLITSLPLAVADVVTLTIMVAIVSLLFGTSGGFLLGLLPFLAAALIIVNAFNGLYPAIGFHPAEELRLTSLSLSSVAVTALALALATSTGAGLIFAGFVLWIGLLIVTPLTRSATRMLAARSDHWAQPVLIVGEVKRASELFREMQNNRTCGLRPLGIIADPVSQWSTEEVVRHEDASFVIGAVEEAVLIAEREGVFWAVVIRSGIQDSDHDDEIERQLKNIPHRLYISEEHHRNGYESIFAESTSFHS